MEHSPHPHISQNLKNLTVWFKDYEAMGNYKEPGRGSETRTFRNIYQVGRKRGSSGSSAGSKPVLPTTVTAHAQISAFIPLLVTDLPHSSWVFVAAAEAASPSQCLIKCVLEE